MKKIGKIPKIRFKIGQIFREKRTNQLYSIRQIFRLKEEPNVWLHILEERKSVENPDNEMSLMCEKSTGKGDQVIIEPVRDYLSAAQRYTGYLHGDSICKNVSQLLHEFILISSGDIL